MLSVCFRLSVCIPTFQLSDQLTYFHETWYGRYAVRGHPNLVLYREWWQHGALSFFAMWKWHCYHLIRGSESSHDYNLNILCEILIVIEEFQSRGCYRFWRYVKFNRLNLYLSQNNNNDIISKVSYSQLQAIQILSRFESKRRRWYCEILRVMWKRSFPLCMVLKPRGDC